MVRRDRLVIRHAALSDSAALAGLLGELGYPSTNAFVRNKLRRLYGKKGERVFVAARQGRVVGFTSCHIMPLMHQVYNLCRVTALIVAEDHRGGSIGGGLMHAVEQYAKRHKCNKVEVTSGEYRDEAHNFYQRLGYREVSRRFLKVFEANEE